MYIIVIEMVGAVRNYMLKEATMVDLPDGRSLWVRRDA